MEGRGNSLNKRERKSLFTILWFDIEILALATTLPL
jgi:hypothetical protein